MSVNNRAMTKKEKRIKTVSAIIRNQLKGYEGRFSDIPSLSEFLASKRIASWDSKDSMIKRLEERVKLLESSDDKAEIKRFRAAAQSQAAELVDLNYGISQLNKVILEECNKLEAKLFSDNCRNREYWTGYFSAVRKIKDNMINQSKDESFRLGIIWGKSPLDD